ncbi:MAG: DUF2098 family protein [Candidatus Methanomethylophilaceae archaeon]|nr:DUF2098 domain-containing protein [Candidatus Methanomethylophilaceae archaeon]MDY0224486.1 DUF2098 family protein [Candidatus Methanomethylophilaceae archaeon]
MPMIEGDVLKYMPTLTVGKVTDIRDKGGKTWVKLDRTNLYYDVSFLQSVDESEYKASSFKERERSIDAYKGTGKTIDDLKKFEEEIDISTFTPSGGG